MMRHHEKRGEEAPVYMSKICATIEFEARLREARRDSPVSAPVGTGF